MPIVRSALARVVVADLDAALPLYRRLSGAAERRFEFAGVQLAWVGDFLLLSGDPAAIAQVQRVATLLVDDMDAAHAAVVEAGGEVLTGPADAPNGPRMIARHPDGAVFEYIAARTQPPPGYHVLTPRMIVPDVAATVAFLRDVFGAAGEAEAARPAELRIGDSLVMVSEVGEREAFPALLYVYVDDVDATYDRAIRSGAISVEEPRQLPYGDRHAIVRDPWGSTYQLARRQTAR